MTENDITYFRNSQEGGLDGFGSQGILDDANGKQNDKRNDVIGKSRGAFTISPLFRPFRRLVGLLAGRGGKESEGLKQELADEKRNTEILERTINNLQRYIDNTEHLLGPQASDDNIIERFEVLIGSIRTWSLKFSTNPTASQCIKLSQEELDIYHQVSPKFKTREELLAILQEEKSRRLLAKGLVAYVISSTIFRCQNSLNPPFKILQSKDCEEIDLWLEKPFRKCVSELESDLYNQGKTGLRELNTWRALTVELLTRSRDDNATLPEDTSDYLTQLKAVITDLMAPLVAPGWDGFEDLLDILKEAVELSNFFRHQLPCWSVRFHPMPISTTKEIARDKIMRYDPNTMESHQFDDDKNLLAELEVKFIVSPGLYKRGTLEGDQFETESIVRKRKVVCYDDHVL
ncbi:hypothetical protein EG329_007365 [Mollisiaceae sp. DMI_Dod_QoI]|nr:hypothetical protein EG329_007365 [Helotiales sp. DMI_Dod_QoI]